MTSFAARRNRLRRLVRDAEVDALLVTNFINVSYLTGFTGDDSYLLVTGGGESMVSDMRYTTQLAEECPGLNVEIRGPGERMLPLVASLVQRAKIQRLGIEADSAVVALQQSLVQALPKSEIVATS